MNRFAVAPENGVDVEVFAYMSSEQAEALANLVNRLRLTELRGKAESELEACFMRDALARLRDGLVEAGFSPP